MYSTHYIKVLRPVKISERVHFYLRLQPKRASKASICRVFWDVGCMGKARVTQGKRSPEAGALAQRIRAVNQCWEGWGGLTLGLPPGLRTPREGTGNLLLKPHSHPHPCLDPAPSPGPASSGEASSSLIGLALPHPGAPCGSLLNSYWS